MPRGAYCGAKRSGNRSPKKSPLLTTTGVLRPRFGSDRLELRAPPRFNPNLATPHSKNMAQAIMDPEEVRRFAKELKRFNEEVQTRASALQARFIAVGGTWQDQEHEKFAEEFMTTMKVLKKFIEVSENTRPSC